ncbi:hypothetical protein PO124_04065 [Bacillus licheniformis]|nr:hypothetical protein [Bacillus licheniformis]
MSQQATDRLKARFNSRKISRTLGARFPSGETADSPNSANRAG